MLSAKQNIDLLNRVQRTFNLKRLIERLTSGNSSVFDAGCGSGILSVWAAQAGAERVFAVDNGDMQMPRKMASANRCDETIEFHQADLNGIDIPADDRDRFDLLLAMVYLNDPRRDKGQVELAHRLSRNFVKSGGNMIPDRIVYHARLASWPEQHTPTRHAGIEREVRNLEEIYGLNMQPLLEARLARPEKEDFPNRGPDGCIARNAMLQLCRSKRVFEHSYRSSELTAFPERLEFDVTQDGGAHVLVWQQKLYFEDFLIFQNESISWIENPVMLRAGQACVLKLGSLWRTSNLVRLELP